MALAKWDPLQNGLEPLSGLRHGIDRIFDEFFGSLPMSRAAELTGRLAPGTFSPPIELKETESEFVLKAELPGLSKEDLSVDITDDSVTLQGERKEETESAEACYRCRESRYGAFRRVIEMPQEIVPENARAKLENGILSLVLPKADSGARRHIRVQVD